MLVGNLHDDLQSAEELNAQATFWTGLPSRRGASSPPTSNSDRLLSPKADFTAQHVTERSASASTERETLESQLPAQAAAQTEPSSSEGPPMKTDLTTSSTAQFKLATSPTFKTQAENGAPCHAIEALTLHVPAPKVSQLRPVPSHLMAPSM